MAQPANAALRLRQHGQLKRAIEKAAGSGQQCPQCHQSLHLQECRAVPYWGAAGHIILQLPGLLCNNCNELWESVPVTYDRFGNAPKQPGVVFSSDLLQLCRLLSKGGLSATDFCAAQTDLQAYREAACDQDPSGKCASSVNSYNIPCLSSR